MRHLMDNIVHVRLPRPLLDVLTDESYSTGISKQDLIRKALINYFEKKYDKDVFIEADQIKPNYKNNEKLF